MDYWLVKQEPEAYSYDDLVGEGKTDWTGVRNYQARNNLALMKKGDRVIFYHSGSQKAAVGISKVSRLPYPDPTDEKWTAVEIEPVTKFRNPVTLEQIKANKSIENIGLIRQSRLSVISLTENEFQEILSMAE